MQNPNIHLTSESAKLQLADSSRALACLTANMVYDEPALFDILVDLSFDDDGQIAQRASRVVSICSEKFPGLFQPHLSRVISKLKDLKNEGAIRNILKIMSEVPVKITRKDRSILLNLCFDYLVSPEFPISVRVYSMQVLFNLSQEIPEIGEELFRILEEQLPESSAGYQSRARKIMKKLQRAGGIVGTN